LEQKIVKASLNVDEVLNRECVPILFTGDLDFLEE